MNRIVGLVGWFCRQLSLQELLTAATLILEVLEGKRLDIKCRDAFRQEHPHYRQYDVDPEPPLTACPAPKQRTPSGDYQQLLEQYRLTHGQKLKPVNRRDNSTQVPRSVRCPNCHAPGKYLYHNDGKQRSQLRCKVCGELFKADGSHRSPKAKFWCPLCGAALYVWKQSSVMSIYKCPNDQCPRYISAKAQLNPKEQKLQPSKTSQFKLRYQYREHHFDPKYLVPAAPDTSHLGRIDRIHNSLHTLGLVLSFNVSCGLSARQTAYVMSQIFQTPISHQTVLNYAQAAAVLCHAFNLHYKGPSDPQVAGDETYVRVADRWNYAWFTIGTTSRAIHAYHLSDTRGTRDALITLAETLRTAPENITTELVADGNPAYDSATHAINQPALLKGLPLPLKRRTVIGLTNDDPESSEYRAFKQIIERLNRTFKFHTRSRSGFKDFNGALALTVLFVTHYNFLRPHGALRYKCPVSLDPLQGIHTLQDRWGKILQMAAELPSAA